MDQQSSIDIAASGRIEAADINRDGIAPELIALPRWLAWREEQGDRPGKNDKVPYSVRTKKKCNPHNPTSWAPFDDAYAFSTRLVAFEGCLSGIGIDLGKLDDGRFLGGVDLDACLTAGGAVAPWAAEIVARLGSYTEISPSGTGLKAFFLVGAGDAVALGITTKNQRWPGEGHAPGIELYLDGRYFTVTGRRHPDAPEALWQVPLADLRWLVDVAFPAFTAAGPASPPAAAGAVTVQGGRNAPGWRYALWRDGATTGSRKDAIASLTGKALTLGKDLRTILRVLRRWDEKRCHPSLRSEDRGRMDEVKRTVHGIGRARATELGLGKFERFEELADALRRDHQQTRRQRGSSEPDSVAALMDEFNNRYMVVLEAGKTIVYKPAYDPIMRRKAHWRLTFSDFRNAYLNRTVVVGYSDEKPIKKNAAAVWLAHSERRQYLGGVAFDPSGEHVEPDALNLWQGFAIKPQPGSWALLQEHVRTVICRGDAGIYEYLLNWMARLVQRPAEQGEVAVVMRSVEGTGKGTLARALMRLLGQHALAISNGKHLIGNFNAHLRDCVLLFADEAFFAGDKQHVGVLKSLITEPHLTVEAKYQNAVQTPNFLHLMIASNEEWVVPASLEARRFLVLDVATDKIGDFAYFEAIRQEMEAGGYAAMLHDLLTRDLKSFNVRDFPNTSGLGEQKKLSLDTTHRWWVEVLQRGYVYDSRHGLADTFTRWMPSIATGLLYLSYSAFAERHKERRPVSRETLGRFMREVGGNADRISGAIIGEELTRATDDSGYARTAGKTITQGRAGGYVLGTLEDARTAFAKATKLPVEWEDVEDEPVSAQDDHVPF